MTLKRIGRLMVALTWALSLGALSFFAQPEPEEEGVVTLTVYEQDLGLVEEFRTLELAEGQGTYTLKGVPARLIPSSVRLEVHPSVPTGREVEVLDQRFIYDPISVQALLKRHIGQTIEVFAPGGAGTYRGTLLSLEGGIVLEEPSGRVRVIKDATRFELADADLSAFTPEPQLRWTLQSSGSGGSHPQAVRLRLSLSYLTQGIGWRADYQGVLDESQNTLDLVSWVTVDNASGEDFRVRTLQLVSGRLHRAAGPSPPFAEAEARALAPAREAFREEAAFEYHTYRLELERALELPTGEPVQLAFLSAKEVPFAKSYLYDARVADGVQVIVEFVNAESSGLGRALPPGTVRLFLKGQPGTLFIGEDRLAHTPVDEPVTLSLGLAFDLAAERVQTEHRALAGDGYRDAFKITLRNHKSEDVTVRVREHLQGDWRITESSIPFEKVDARTVEFAVEVPAGGQAELTYAVEYRF